ncbi:hypothetical protein SEUCBS139899_005575 [Sporothrix eucalyptigena]|uniref:Major facilitator superfamily (MFS) profile domain-containing protein n=1 Tax=Sporothrix eucalyptigena TaxID=1812306 RepID=A0ABP0C0V4_9PEZI
MDKERVGRSDGQTDAAQLRDTSPAPEAFGDNLPPGYYRSSRFLGSVAAASLSAISAYLGWVMPANILSIIDADIGPSPNLTWVAISYTLCYSVSATLVGRLSDIFGRRWFFVLGGLFAVLASILGATAQSINQLIASGCFTGFAATFQLAFPIVLGELVPYKRRAHLNGFVFLCCLPISAFGTIIARTLTAKTALGWRWCYYLNLISSAISVILYVLFYHPPRFNLLHTKRSRWNEFKHLDFGGLILFTGGLVLLLLGLNWGGQSYPWKSAKVIATILVGALSLVAFALYEAFMPLSHPLIPMSLFANSAYVALVLCASVCSMIYYSINVIWPTEISALFTTDLVQIGWLSCTIGAGTVLGQVVAGATTKRIGKQRWQLIVCEACVTAFIGSLAAVNASRKSLAIAGTFIGSFFVGYVELVTLTCAPMACAAEDIGLATGVLSSIRAAGGSLATAIYVTILDNKLDSYTPEDISAAVLGAGLPESSLSAFLTAYTASNTTALYAIPGVNSTILAAAGAGLQQAYSQSFSIVYLATIAFGGCAVISALFAPNMDDKMTDEVARKLQGVQREIISVGLDREEKADAQMYETSTAQ